MQEETIRPAMAGVIVQVTVWRLMIAVMAAVEMGETAVEAEIESLPDGHAHPTVLPWRVL